VISTELIAQRGASVVTVDGRAADIFSFGCTLYAVFTGELPFHEASEDTSEEYRCMWVCPEPKNLKF
jgi:serine/threonine protein kinase